MQYFIKSICGDMNIPSFNLKLFLSNYFFNSSFRLLFNHRLSKYWMNRGSKVGAYISTYYKSKQLLKRSCDISNKSDLGRGIVFPHPIGIVIGEDVVIGENARIYQNVTFGSHGKYNRPRQYPKTGANIIVYAGAVIVGDILIGHNVTVGANAFVNRDVPDNAIAVGNPCTIIYR